MKFGENYDFRLKASELGSSVLGMRDFSNESEWAGGSWASPGSGGVECCGSGALLVIDQVPFLKKALGRCKRLRKELHKKQELLREYEESDCAAYHRWLNTTFGSLLSRIRDSEEELSRYRFIAYQLTFCARRFPEKMEAVHKELFRRKADNTLSDFIPPGFESDSETGERKQDYDEVREGFEGLFDEIFGDADEETRERGKEDFRRAGIDFGEPWGSAHKPEKDPELKTCYRLMAKRLHRDHSTLEETVREKRWHEMQAAYDNNDLETLRRVEAVCDMDEGGLTIKLGLARLNELAEYHQSHLEPIRAELRRVKREPAYEFARKGPAVVEKKTRYEMEAVVEALKRELDYLRETTVDPEFYGGLESAESIPNDWGDEACDDDWGDDDDDFREDDFDAADGLDAFNAAFKAGFASAGESPQSPFENEREYESACADESSWVDGRARFTEKEPEGAACDKAVDEDDLEAAHRLFRSRKPQKKKQAPDPEEKVPEQMDLF